MKFSDLIGDLTNTWLLWMKNNDIVRSSAYTIKERKKAAIECEELINKEYELVSRLDNFFQ